MKCHQIITTYSLIKDFTPLFNLQDEKITPVEKQIQIRHQGSSAHRQTIRCDVTMPVAQRVEYFIAKTPVKIEIGTPL